MFELCIAVNSKCNYKLCAHYTSTTYSKNWEYGVQYCNENCKISLWTKQGVVRRGTDLPLYCLNCTKFVKLILRKIAEIGAKSLNFSTTLWFNPPTEGFPWDDLRKILPGCCQVTNVLHGAETLPKISVRWVGCTNVTDRRQTDDRQTDDRQTDGRRPIANMNMSSRSLTTVSDKNGKNAALVDEWHRSKVGLFAAHFPRHVPYCR